MSLVKRISDLIIEILIAVILVTAFVVYLFMVPKEKRLSGRWLPLILNTAIVFGFLISWFRPEWKRAKFWTLLGLLLVCHSAVYILLLTRIGHFPLIVYVAVNAAELVFFSQILGKLAAWNPVKSR